MRRYRYKGPSNEFLTRYDYYYLDIITLDDGTDPTIMVTPYATDKKDPISVYGRPMHLVYKDRNAFRKTWVLLAEHKCSHCNREVRSQEWLSEVRIDGTLMGRVCENCKPIVSDIIGTMLPYKVEQPCL